MRREELSFVIIRSSRRWRLLASIVIVEILLDVGLYDGLGHWIFRAPWFQDPTVEPIMHTLWLLCVSTPVLWAVLHRAAKHEEALLQTVWDQAHHDDLTGLANRRLFVQQLETALDGRSQREILAVLLVDLDNFKSINDSFGHHVGDMVLRTLAERLARIIDPTDAIARLGGDEFAVLMPTIRTVHRATEQGEALLNQLREPVTSEGFELVLGASIGVAIYPTSGLSAEDLVKSADVAMYQAKTSGKNRWTLHLPALQDQTYARYQLERDLRRALTIDSELSVQYQPQVDIKTGRIRSSEALIRWQHPVLGTVSPMHFIPMAEAMGLSADVGRYVRRTVYHQIHTWEQDGYRPLPVSINASAHELTDPGFAASILQELAFHGISPAAISLEVTETGLMRDLRTMRAQLTILRRAGIPILIDDFGTGYNSLSIVRELPVDGLKLDGSFVQHMHTDDHDTAAVSALVKMGRAFGLKIIAECVEHHEQLTLLQHMQCDLYQGFLCSASVAGPEFAERYLLRKEKV